MKTTQVVSGFLLGTSLLIQTTSAQVVFDDGGVHILNDARLRDEYIQVLAGTTLRLEAGAEIGGAFNELGSIDVFDTSTVIVAGGRIGVGGGSSGLIMLNDDSQLVMEDGVLCGDAASSGQVIAMGRSSIVVQGGQVGGAGEQSGLVGFFDEALGEIRGGQFGGSGEYSGLVLGFGNSQVQVFACESELIPGPVVELSGNIVAVTKIGATLAVPFMREATAVIALVEDCDDDGGGGVDTDGDGVLDASDLCIESDLRSTLWIFNINTCIPNLIEGKPVNSDGCSLADLVTAMISEASENARSRGEFVRAVAHGLRQMRQDGLLPSRFHRHFLNCADRSNWDDAKKRKRNHQRDSRRRR
jgi:hypothetical protein